MHRTIIPFTLLCGLIWLGVWSRQDQGYAMADIAAVDALAAGCDEGDWLCALHHSDVYKLPRKKH